MNYSGKFVLRIDPGLHETLARRAGDSGESLNQFCSKLLEAGLRAAPAKPRWLTLAQAALPLLKRRFGKDLLAVAVLAPKFKGGPRPIPIWIYWSF